jgi:hypothetical protein
MLSLNRRAWLLAIIFVNAASGCVDSPNIISGRWNCQRARNQPVSRPQQVAAINAAIVEATLNAFANDGSSSIRLRRGRASAKQAIYRRWDTKLDLLFHAIDRLLADRLSALPSDLPDPHRRAAHGGI